MNTLKHNNEVKVILFNGMNGEITQETIKSEDGSFLNEIRRLMFDDFFTKFPEQEKYGNTIGLTPSSMVKELTDSKSPNNVFPLKYEYEEVIMYNDDVGKMRDMWETELMCYNDLLIGSLVLFNVVGYGIDGTSVYGDLILDEEKLREKQNG